MIRKIWRRSRKNRIIITTAGAAWIICSISWQLIDRGAPAITAWLLSGAYLTMLWISNKK